MEALILFFLVSAVISWLVWRVISRWRMQQQLIESFDFPANVLTAIRTQYPHVSRNQAEVVVECLRDFFRFYRSGTAITAIQPSVAVDVAWRAFTKEHEEYHEFCQSLCGSFLDFTPCQPMHSEVVQPGLRVSWTAACSLEKIDPEKPVSLPRLFSIDQTLEIQDGNFYHVGENNHLVGFDARTIGRHVELV